LIVLLEAARWAASSYNEQPWRFVVARKADGSLYDRLLGILEPFNQGWAKTAPVLMITAAKRHFTHTGAINLHALHDTGAALAQLFLQATALGLHAHGMAGFNREKARIELGIPDDFELGAAAAIGYLGSPDDLAQPYKDRELSPRQRKPLSDIIFGGHWNEPLAL
jgi:nitroreductase